MSTSRRSATGFRSRRAHVATRLDLAPLFQPPVAGTAVGPGPGPGPALGRASDIAIDALVRRTQPAEFEPQPHEDDPEDDRVRPDQPRDGDRSGVRPNEDDDAGDDREQPGDREQPLGVDDATQSDRRHDLDDAAHDGPFPDQDHEGEGGQIGQYQRENPRNERDDAFERVRRAMPAVGTPMADRA